MPPKELPKSDAPEEKPQPPKKKRSGFKIVMLLLGFLLVFGGGGGAGYWWLYLRPDAPGLESVLNMFKSTDEKPAPVEEKQNPEKSQSTQVAEKPKAKGSSSTAPKAVQKPVSLPQVTVNLADPPGNRYLKLSMDVEFNTPDASKTIETESARVRDAIILLLSSKKAKDLTTPEGKVILKNEIAGRLNQVLGSSQVVRVFFTDFVIQ